MLHNYTQSYLIVKNTGNVAVCDAGVHYGFHSGKVRFFRLSYSQMEQHSVDETVSTVASLQGSLTSCSRVSPRGDGRFAKCLCGLIPLFKNMIKGLELRF